MSLALRLPLRIFRRSESLIDHRPRGTCPPAILRTAEAAALLAAVMAAGALTAWLVPGWEMRPARLAAFALLFAGLLLPLLAHEGRVHAETGRGGAPWICLLSAAVVAGLGGAMQVLAAPVQMPPGFYLLLAVLAPAGVSALRAGAPPLWARFQAWARGRVPARRHVTVIAEAECRALAETLAHTAPAGTRVTLHELPAHGRARRAAVRQLAQDLAGTETDEVCLALAWERWSAIQGIAAELAGLPIPVRLLAEPRVGRILQGGPERRAGLASFALPTASRDAPRRWAKRGLDLVGAGVGLILLAPLFLAVALAIRIDGPGPVFFRQSRGGLRGRSFRIWKFRTMRVAEDGPGIVQAQRGDARITALGAWLRSTSIDELPQLLNVLGGEMSLIGPRPHALAHDAQYGKAIRAYPQRYYVKPGLTGWAQVNGSRGETREVADMRTRVDLDLWYVRHWSLRLDVRILLLTLFAQQAHRSAY